MSSDPWGFDNDPFADDDRFGSPVGVADGKAGGSGKLRRGLFGALSVAVAAVTLVVSLAGSAGFGAVVVSALAYLLAVWVDCDAREQRHRNRNPKRPLVTASLRSLTFAAALGVGWLAASSLAGAT